ncbi:aminotransferase [Paraphysoderma sedebokerense]|nr:aminotransferase [Paraphysoderma sedebokerense]
MVLRFPSNLIATAGFYLLQDHINRIFSAVDFFYESSLQKLFNLPSSTNPDKVRSELIRLESEWRKEFPSQSSFRKRIRLLLSPNGTFRIESTNLVPSTPLLLPLPTTPFQQLTQQFETIEPKIIVLGTQPVDQADVFLRYKTTNRKVYDDARNRHISKTDSPIFDVLLYNQYNEITECCIANIALKIPSTKLVTHLQQSTDSNPVTFIWVTPLLSCGLLNGTLRNQLVQNGDVIEQVVSVEMLVEAVKVQN